MIEQFITKVFQDLLYAILKLIDGVCRLFGIMVGLEQVDFEKDGIAESSTLIEFFLEQDLFVQIFLTLFVISLIILAFCTAFAIFRTMFSDKSVNETKTHSKTIGQSVKSLITTCLIFVVTLTAISSSNLLLKTVNKAITGQDGIGISRVILELGLNKTAKSIDKTSSNHIKYYQLNGEWEEHVSKDLQDIWEKELATRGNIWDEENGAWNWYILKDTPVEIEKQRKQIDSIYKDGYLTATSSDEIWGTYTTNFFGLPNGGWTGGKINGSGYNALMPYIASFIILYILCMTCFTLVKRLFDIIVLFFVLPFVNATVPLDDGAHMKLWRETMISKILLAFGATVSIAVFNIFAPLIINIYIDGNDTLTNVLRLMLVVGGGLSISGGMALISRLIGTGIAEGNEMAQSARTLLAGGAGALMLGKKAVGYAGKGVSTGARLGTNALFGAKQADGERGLGLTKLLFGSSTYKDKKSGISNDIKNKLENSPSRLQNFVNNGGLMGKMFNKSSGGMQGAIKDYSRRNL